VEGHVIAAAPPLPEWFKTTLREFFLCWRQTVTVEMGRAYWATLSDCDPHDVAAAALDLRRGAGGEWPPSASTWHQVADQIGRDRRLRETIQLGREQHWRAECQDCDDTGWQSLECTATARCGRPRCDQAEEAFTHGYAAVCPCRPTNSTYQRSRDRERTSARRERSRTA
jgi:hypothetical protein